MQIRVDFDVDRLTKSLTNAQRQQVPFATSVALNEVGKDVSRAVTVQMDRYLEKPTPFTRRAYELGKNFKRATKRNLVAILDPKEIQGEYLKFQIEGGRRLPDQKVILVPTKLAPKNQYGNLSRANRKRAVQGGGKYFSAGDREGKTPGIYVRRARGRVEPFAFYVDEAKYKAIFPIQKIAAGVVKNMFPRRFSQALAKAMASAR
jgi:hypothetical protein